LKVRNFGFLATTAAFILASSSLFATPTLQFTLNGGTPVTCADQAACDTNGVVGVVSDALSMGGVVVSIDGTGATKPAQTDPIMDLDIDTISLAAGKSLVLEFSETGFTTTGGFELTFGPSISCSKCTVTDAAYFDGTDALFGTGTLIATQSFTGSGSKTTPGAGPSSGTYSLTQIITVTNTGSSTMGMSGDFQLNQVPEPTSILLLGSIVSGIGFALRRKLSPKATV
jgi:hypothetical protein